MAGRVAACLLLSLFLTAATGVRATADERVAGAVVVLAAGPRLEGQDTVRRVVASSIELELAQYGIAVLDGGTWVGSQTPSWRPGAIDADFALVADLMVREADLDVDLALSSIETGQVLARVRTTEVVGLTLDRAVAGLTARLVEQARANLAAAGERRRSQPPPPAERPASRRAQPESLPAESGRVAPGEPGLEPGEARRRRLFDVSARYAPLVPIDRTARFLGPSQGVGLSLTILPFASDWIGFGLTAHGVMGTATGLATSAELLLASAGASLLLSADEGAFTPHLRLVGGAAFMRATNEVLGTRESVVPYAAGELGARVRLLGVLALELTVGFESYWSGPMPLFGFVPGIGLVIRV